MESAYLKNHVGPILAKGIAETVLAQPSDPQEYLALYLLHNLQETERRAAHVRRQQKAEELRQMWSSENSQREKLAVDTIQRGFQAFRTRLVQKKKNEAELQELYDEAVEEAEDLLDQLEDDDDNAGGDHDDHDNNEEGDDNNEEDTQAEKLEQQAEELAEARSDFYRVQRFILTLQKSHIGKEKEALVASRERVRVAQSTVHNLRDKLAIREEQAEEVHATGVAPHLSAAASMLADRMADVPPHNRISVALVRFRVLRCLCYLLFNSTPKATDTPDKVAQLIKPTVMTKLIRAFDPVATYDKHKANKLERMLPDGGAGGDDEEDNDGNNANDEEDEESEPLSQPKTRQVRRVKRVMRTCLQDCEYVDVLNPSDYLDEEDMEEDEALKKQCTDAEAGVERLKHIREVVEGQTKERGGVALWALLAFVESAARYRSARDAWANTRRDMGLNVSEKHELPEEEEEDTQNEEVLMTDEGEVDVAEMDRLIAKIGIDSDEAVAKVWEAMDARRKKVLEEQAEAFRKAAEEEEEEDEGDDEEL